MTDWTGRAESSRAPPGPHRFGGARATLHLLDEPLSRRLHAIEDWLRIDAEPDDRGHERRQKEQLAAVQVWQMLVHRLVERVEENALDGPQEIRRGEDDRRRRDECHDGIGSERTYQHQKFTDEAVRP